MPDSLVFSVDFLGAIAQYLRTLSYQVILCDPPEALTKNSTVADIAKYELRTVNGYAPVAYNPALGSYDTTDKRHELGSVSATFSASETGSLTFSHAVLLRGTARTVANTPVLSVDTSGDRLQINSAITLVNATPVLVTSSGATPGGVDDSTVYYTKAGATGYYQLYSDVGLATLVDLTSAGSGTITLRVVPSGWASFRAIGPTTIAAGASYPISLDWAIADVGADATGVV